MSNKTLNTWRNDLAHHIQILETIRVSTKAQLYKTQQQILNVDRVKKQSIEALILLEGQYPEIKPQLDNTDVFFVQNMFNYLQ